MMPPPRTPRFRLILAAVDFSRPSAKALRYATAIARASGGRVLALHAIDPLLDAAAARAYAEQTVIDDTRADLVKFVRSAVGADAAASVDCEAVVGAARQTLIARSRKLHPDVIVMGTNGRGGVAKAFFGSTTEALLRRYDGPVMVIPRGCPDPLPGWPGPSVLAAIGSGPRRHAMMMAAARTADVLGAWLSAVDLEGDVPRSCWHQASLVLLPMPAADRFTAFRQGTAAYRFVCRTRRPVLVVHTGRRIGHASSPRRAA
jgi:nucleotide-binding universal stress UspA family protein